MKYFLALLALFSLFLLAGCPTKPRPFSTSEKPVAGTATANTTGSSGDIAVTDGAGKSVLAVKQDGVKYKVSGAAGALGELKFKDGEIKLYDTKDAKLGKVKLDDGDFSLKNAGGDKLFKLAPKEGGYRLKDPKGNIVLKMKPKDTGFKVSKNDVALAKVKSKDGKLVISDEGGKTLYTVTGVTNAGVAGLLLSKDITPLQQAALIVAAQTLK